jgi:hypothetical protein
MEDHRCFACFYFFLHPAKASLILSRVISALWLELIFPMAEALMTAMKKTSPIINTLLFGSCIANI